MRSDNIKRHQETCLTDRKQGGARIKNKKISESKILNKAAKTKKSAPKRYITVTKQFRKIDCIVAIRIFEKFLFSEQRDRIDEMSKNHKLSLLLAYEDLNKNYPELANMIVMEPAFVMNLFNDTTY